MVEMAEVANDPLYLWKAYCDKKMELEDAEDYISELESALRAIIAVAKRYDTPTWNVVQDTARIALESKQ